MTIPNVDEVFSDGGLGLLPEDIGQTTLSVGVAADGTPNTLYAFSNPDDLKAALVGGPVVEAVALKLAEPGHGPQLVMPVTASTAGANGSVTQVGGGPAITLTGAPKDDYDVTVKVTAGGVLGTSTFVYTTDGGDTWSDDIATAATYPLGDTGVTLHLAAGTYVVGTTYAFLSTAPYYTTTDLTNALNAAKAIYNTNPWSLCHVVGVPGGVDDAAKSTACATVFATVDAIAAAYWASHRFPAFVIEGPDVADAALILAFASLASPYGRTSVAAGFAEVVSQLNTGVEKRSSAWPYMARLSAIPISQDAAWVGAGPLNAVRSIYHDEDATPTLDAARFVTLRTFLGEQGFFVTNPRTMATASSDYRWMQHVRIGGVMARVAHNGMLYYLNGKTRVDKVTGRILEQDAAGIDTDIKGQEDAALTEQGHVTDAVVRMNRTDNVLSTGKLRISAKAIPLNYPKHIEITLGFINPALQPAAA